MRRRITWLMAWLCASIGVSCEHNDLCYNHDSHTAHTRHFFAFTYEKEWEYNVENHIDWEQCWSNDMGTSYDALRPDEPSGVRIHIFGSEGESEKMLNLDSAGEAVYFNHEGYYSALLHNNDTEYILFQGLNAYSSAYATTRGINRASYKGNSTITRTREEITVNAPDMLYGAHLEELYIEKRAQPDTLNVELHPLVYTYVIRYEFAKGAEHVALARGALAGMAMGVHLSDGHTSDEEATVLFDAAVTEFGAMAHVRSFGVPDYPNEQYARTTRQYGLNLEVRLKDGSTRQFDFNITEQMARQPKGGVIVVDGIEVDMHTTGGGFEIEVEGWGDQIDIPLDVSPHTEA